MTRTKWWKALLKFIFLIIRAMNRNLMLVTKDKMLQNKFLHEIVFSNTCTQRQKCNTPKPTAGNRDQEVSVSEQAKQKKDWKKYSKYAEEKKMLRGKHKQTQE